MGVELHRVPFTHPHVAALVDEVQAEYTLRYGGPDETPLEPTMFEPPDGAFFVGYRDGEPVAMGGWRLREDVATFDGPSGGRKVSEIKRMYVVPRARRAGLARAVLGHLETTARDAGAVAMVLETGIEQPEAISLYLSSGYGPIEGFGVYKWSSKSRYYGKLLPGA